MEAGRIVEYIDRQRILCAAVLEVKSGRLRLVSEHGRELNLTPARLLFTGHGAPLAGLKREATLEGLRQAAARREALSRGVNVRELWEVLHEEGQWIDLPTLTALCFPEAGDDDHAAAVLRALFSDRLHFRFDRERFLPQAPAELERSLAQRAEAERRQRMVEQGGVWLRRVLNGGAPGPDPAGGEITELLRSYFLFEKECLQAETGRALLERAGLVEPAPLFGALVRLGVFGEHENLDLHRLEIATEFAPAVCDCATALLRAGRPNAATSQRRDLTDLPLMTIDGQATLDFDDAISIEELDGGYRLGIHIADVAAYVAKGDVIDQAALERASSIYMPDRRIPMLPLELAEGCCSLRAGELRPAISVLAQLGPLAEIRSWEIVASTIRVRDQRTYHEVNQAIENERPLALLRELATRLRQRRLDAAAVHIALPEVNLWLDESGQVVLNRLNRESPSRMLVAELMILANWLMARFLAERGLPAIFRAQPEPRERLFRGEEGSLFQHYMQRKLLARLVLGPHPEKHVGLGLEAYVTATSPIRKYVDLVAQRQIRAGLGLEEPYDESQIAEIMRLLETPMGNVGRIQQRRNRYWLLKYLEARTGSREEAIVLGHWRRSHHVLLPAYMLECELQGTGGRELKPEMVVQVTLQHVDARRDALTIFMT